MDFFKGNGSGAAQQRTEATSADADRYFEGLDSKKVLGKKIRTRDGHDCWKVEKKCEYMGIKFKKGDYISRDTLHHEFEWFRGVNTHKGAINVLTGEKYKEGKPSRVLYIK